MGDAVGRGADLGQQPGQAVLEPGGRLCRSGVEGGSGQIDIHDPADGSAKLAATQDETFAAGLPSVQGRKTKAAFGYAPAGRNLSRFEDLQPNG